MSFWRRLTGFSPAPQPAAEHPDVAGEVLAILPSRVSEIAAGPSVSSGQRRDLYRVRNAGIVTIAGPLFRSSYDAIRQAFEAAVAADDIGTVVLHIESSGGAVTGLLNLADAIHAARGKKPIIALIDELAASAAYVIAAAADRVVLASPLANVGSVGVLALHADLSAAAEKAGIKITQLAVGERKLDGSPHAPLSETATNELMAKLQGAFDEISERVARFRKIPIAAIVKQEAAVFQGKAAVEARLADAILTPNEFIAALGGDAPSTIARGFDMNTLQDPAARPEMPAELAAALGINQNNRACTFDDIAKLAKLGGFGAEETLRLAGASIGKPMCVVADAVLGQLADRQARSAIHGALSPDAGLDKTFDNPNFLAEAAADALIARYNPSHKPSAEAREFIGLTIPELARSILKRRGIETLGKSPAGLIQAALHTTSDFPLLLGDFANRSLRRVYDTAPSGLRRVARQKTAADFRDLHRLQPGEWPALEKVNEKGEFKSGTFGEDAVEGYRLATYGKIMGISRQALVNDDLQTFSDMSRRIALAVVEFENQQLAKLINSNPAMGDEIALFHGSHGNLAPAGGPIDGTTLSAARQALREQKGVDGQVYINTAPKFLLVSSARETEAERAVAEINPTTTDDANPFTGLVPIVDPRLTAEPWYLVGDPEVIDGLEYSYLAGEPGPITTTEQGFDYDGVRTKVRLDFACAFVEWRGWYRNEGDEES